MKIKKIYKTECPNCHKEQICADQHYVDTFIKLKRVCKECYYLSKQKKSKPIDGWKKNCPECGGEQTYSREDIFKKSVKENILCNPCSITGERNGFYNKKHNDKTLNKMSISSKNRWTDPSMRNKMVENSKWINVKVDKGQIEFINKWNQLGFNFQVNYQLKDNNGFLEYLDGYDKNKNVVIEYDGSGHYPLKDLPRQNKIIEMLQPKAFWRYNRKMKTIQNVMGGM